MGFSVTREGRLLEGAFIGGFTVSQIKKKIICLVTYFHVKIRVLSLKLNHAAV